MAIEYSPETLPIHPGKLGAREHRAIGRLVRACADIEDMVTLFIANLSGASNGAVIVMLGMTPISKRISIAEYFAKARGSDAVRRHAKSFNAALDEILLARNAVTHGVMLGKAGGKWAFLTAKTDHPEHGRTMRQVSSFSTTDLTEYADQAEKAAIAMEEDLGLQAWRQKRREQPLGPHRKGLQKGTPSAKRKRPPQA